MPAPTHASPGLSLPGGGGGQAAMGSDTLDIQFTVLPATPLGDLRRAG